MKAAHVPEETAFATKPALAVAMIERAIAARVPFAWIAADSVYGVGGVESALRRAGKPLRSLDPQPVNPPQYCGPGPGFLLNLGSGGHTHRNARARGRLPWAIEDSFETAKNELGLDHNETRSWHVWHRHVSLVMQAFAMMAAARHRANNMTEPLQTLPSLRLSAGLFRKSAA